MKAVVVEFSPFEKNVDQLKQLNKRETLSLLDSNRTLVLSPKLTKCDRILCTYNFLAVIGRYSTIMQKMFENSITIHSDSSIMNLYAFDLVTYTELCGLHKTASAGITANAYFAKTAFAMFLTKQYMQYYD